MSKVYVAVSGGVDSSVALALLRDQGYDVTGIYFKTYKPDGDKEYCRQQGTDAQKVCEHLGVPFKVYDLEEEYKQRVFDYMIDGYKAGRTPNPDIICNKEIKFGVFAKRAFADGADMIATGHYATVQDGLLNMALDKGKDQTYFLSQVSKRVLKKTLFPLGAMYKREVRKVAEQYGLLTADKKDSQGICFIGQEMDVKSFLKQYIPEERGDVLNTDSKTIGWHNGVKFYTIGERLGFTIFPEYKSTQMPRLFVLKRNIKTNSLTIGTREELEELQEGVSKLDIKDCNWFVNKPKQSHIYKCRIRHRGDLYKCSITHDDTNNKYTINFIESPYAPAVGQFVAIYDGEVCLGGGEIV